MLGQGLELGPEVPGGAAASVFADVQGDRTVVRLGAGHLALERDAHRLIDPPLGGDLDGEGERDRGAVGLERCVAPVAVVLGLEHLAGHLDARDESGTNLVGQRPDIDEGLVRRDLHRECGLLASAGGVVDDDRAAGQGHRVQDAQPQTVAQERGVSHTCGGEVDRAVGGTGDHDRPREVLRVERAPSGVLDPERVDVLINVDRVEDPRSCSPVAILEGEVDPTDDLGVAEPDAPQVAVVEVGAQRTGADDGRAQSALPTRYTCPVARDSYAPRVMSSSRRVSSPEHSETTPARRQSTH